MDVRMELSRIMITELGAEQVIFLKEVGGERTFPIVIGIHEALAIDRRLKGERAPRPMTHDLLANTIAAMGGTVERVVIDDLRSLTDDNRQTFIATIHIRHGDEVIQIDSRPSDAIALGIAGDTPIYVSRHVLDEVINKPSTPEDRIALLRKRMEFLREQITELSALLNADALPDDAPPDAIERGRRKLTEMRREYEAIEEVLRKHG